MIKILGLFTVVLFVMSCNNSAVGHNNLDEGFKIKPLSQSTIDESKIVLSAVPASLNLINDSTLASIVDFRKIVLYNIKNGQLINVISIDSLMKAASFDVGQYVKNNLANTYNDRRYITDSKMIGKQALPSYKLLSITSPIKTLDSVQVIMSVFTPYEKDFQQKGEKTAATFAEYSLMIANVNISRKIVNTFTAINVKPLNDTSNMSYATPEFGSIISGNKLYSSLFPNLDRPDNMHEFGVFNLQDKQFNFLAPEYPSEFKTNPEKWLPRKSFFMDNDNSTILSNGMFDIYAIRHDLNTEKIVDLKKFFKLDKFEHIHSFAKLEGGLFLIQSIVADSGKYFYDFRFYNTKTNELSTSKLHKITRSISANVIFKDNKIIFISRDEEHYYINTYKMEMP